MFWSYLLKASNSHSTAAILTAALRPSMTTSRPAQAHGRPSVRFPGSWLGWRRPLCATTADYMYKSTQLAHTPLAVSSTLFAKGRWKERGAWCCFGSLQVHTCQQQLHSEGFGTGRHETKSFVCKLLNQTVLRKPHRLGVCTRKGNSKCFDVVSWTYGPMGRVLPLWSRPPGPQISLSIVSVPRFPLSPTNRLFLISCFEPSSWGKVPPLEGKGWRWRGCSQPVPHAVAQPVWHLPRQGQPNAIVCKPAGRREVLQKRFLFGFVRLFYHVKLKSPNQWGGGQQGLVTEWCS